MKTITMDYDLYRNELLAARTEGFNLVPDAIKILKDVSGYYSAMDSRGLDTSMRQVQELIVKLERMDK